MELGVKIGKSKVSRKGQTSLSITLPKQVVENLGIRKGDIIEFYQNPNFGNGILILKVGKEGGESVSSDG